MTKTWVVVGAAKVADLNQEELHVNVAGPFPDREAAEAFAKEASAVDDYEARALNLFDPTGGVAHFVIGDR